MTRGLFTAAAVCQDTTTSDAASAPYCRCSPPTRGAPLRSPRCHSVGPVRSAVRTPATPAPTPAPTIADVPPTISVLRLTSITVRSTDPVERRISRLDAGARRHTAQPLGHPRRRERQCPLQILPETARRRRRGQQRGRPRRQGVGNGQCVEYFGGHPLMTEW